MTSLEALTSHGIVELSLHDYLNTKISNTFFDGGFAGDEVEALHLAKVGVLSGHIDEEEFGEVPGAYTLLIFLT